MKKELLKVVWYAAEGVVLVKGSFADRDTLIKLQDRICSELQWDKRCCLLHKTTDGYCLWNVKEIAEYVQFFGYVLCGLSYVNRKEYAPVISHYEEHFKQADREGKEPPFVSFEGLINLLKEPFLDLFRRQKTVSFKGLVEMIDKARKKFKSLKSSLSLPDNPVLQSLFLNIRNFLYQRNAIDEEGNLISINAFVDACIEYVESKQEEDIAYGVECIVCGRYFVPKKGKWALFCSECRMHKATIQRRLQRLGIYPEDRTEWIELKQKYPVLFRITPLKRKKTKN